MKMKDFPAIESFTEDNILIVDGDNGTKQILVSDAILAALHMTSPETHRTIFRGKNLGTELTAEQKAHIQDGTFEDLWLGDYWVINGVTWRIVDFDYWLNTGDTEFLQHHLVIMPDNRLYNAQMNETNTTEGGYVGSAMYTTNLEQAKTLVASAFGTAVLTHREYLTNAVTDGYPSAAGWYDSTVELPNEIMMYGYYVFTPASTGAIVPNRYTIDKIQLALFQLVPRYITNREGQWNRDVVSAATFACIASNGNANHNYSSNSLGVRPAFAIG